MRRFAVVVVTVLPLLAMLPMHQRFAANVHHGFTAKLHQDFSPKVH